MPGYTSQYVPIDFAIKRIAEHHFGGDETAAWCNVQIAINEGAITTASGNSTEDMLSYIVAGVVKSRTRRNSPKRQEPPAGTWVRRDLEEVYGLIFTVDGGSTPPKKSAGRRKGSGSYDRADAPLLDQMAHIMKTGEATSHRQAAATVVDGAIGGGTEESKIRRLVKKYEDRPDA